MTAVADDGEKKEADEAPAPKSFVKHTGQFARSGDSDKTSEFADRRSRDDERPSKG